MKWLFVVMYIVAGVTTARMVAEVHHQVCTPHTLGQYVVVGALWPVGGVYSMFIGHAISACSK